jgi:hypothetical protein
LASTRLTWVLTVSSPLGGHVLEQESAGPGDGVYTVIGGGKIGSEPPLDDMVSLSLIGVIAGLLTLIPGSVLFATSEFRKGMIRTTYTAPQLRKHGFAPPAFTIPTLTDPGVVRVLLLSALFMTAVAVFALGLGMLLPGESPKLLMYTTLAGALATQRLNPPTQLLAEPWAMISLWAAISVALAYAAAARRSRRSPAGGWCWRASSWCSSAW